MCETGLHALHLPNCLNQNCKSENRFQQEYKKPDLKSWGQCMSELMKNFDWQEKPKDLEPTNNNRTN